MDIKPTHSYVRRIILICIYFLLIPQLVFSLVLLRLEYVLSFKQFMRTLNHVAIEQLEIFQKSLEGFASDINLIHHLIIDKIDQGKVPTSDLAVYSKRIGIEDVYAFQYDGKTWQPKFSLQNPLDKEVFEKLIEKNTAQLHHYLLYFSKEAKKNQLYFLDKENFKEKVDGSILIVKIDPEEFLKRNFYFADWQKSNASFVYDQRIISSTNPDYIEKKIHFESDEAIEIDGIHFIESEDYFGAYRYFFQDKTLFSILKPIPNTELSLLIDSDSIVTEKVWKKMSEHLFLFLGTILLVGIGIVSIYSKRFRRPIVKLLQAMKNVGQGDLKSRYQQTAYGFEINLIGYHFNQMVDALNKVLEDIKNVTIKKEVLETELKLGQSVQKSLQVDRFVNSKELELATYCESARQVGGDFFDYFKVEKNGKQFFVMTIADTAGKGIHACLYALGLRALLRASIKNSSTIEEGIFSANELFVEDSKSQAVFVTAFFVWVDLSSYEMFYTSCGHLPLMLVQDKEVIPFTTSGIALGVIKNIQLDIRSMQMEEGTLFILFSDGMIECVNKHEEAFGIGRFKEALLTTSSIEPEEVKNHLIREINRFKEDQESFDDETLIIFKRPKILR